MYFINVAHSRKKKTSQIEDLRNRENKPKLKI